MRKGTSIRLDLFTSQFGQRFKLVLNRKETTYRIRVNNIFINLFLKSFLKNVLPGHLPTYLLTRVVNNQELRN